jgi:hypothetical protein
MNARIQQLALEAFDPINALASEGVADRHTFDQAWFQLYNKKFAELIVQECVNREELLGAIARGWCSEKNSHKTMDSDLAVAIFDEVEQQIRQQFGVEL